MNKNIKTFKENYEKDIKSLSQKMTKYLQKQDNITKEKKEDILGKIEAFQDVNEALQAANIKDVKKYDFFLISTKSLEDAGVKTGRATSKYSVLIKDKTKKGCYVPFNIVKRPAGKYECSVFQQYPTEQTNNKPYYKDITKKEGPTTDHVNIEGKKISATQENVVTKQELGNLFSKTINTANLDKQKYLVSMDQFIATTGTEQIYNEVLLEYYKELLNNNDIETVKNTFFKKETIKGTEEDQNEIKRKFNEACEYYEANKNILNKIKKYKEKIKSTKTIDDLEDTNKKINKDTELNDDEKEQLNNEIKKRKRELYEQQIEGADNNDTLNEIGKKIEEDNDLDKQDKKDLNGKITKKKEQLTKMQNLVKEIQDEPAKIINKIPEIEQGVDNGAINAYQIFDIYQKVLGLYNNCKNTLEDNASAENNKQNILKTNNRSGEKAQQEAKKYFTILMVLRSLQVKLKLKNLYNKLRIKKTIATEEFYSNTCKADEDGNPKIEPLFKYIKTELKDLGTLNISNIDIDTIQRINYSTIDETKTNNEKNNNKSKKIKDDEQQEILNNFKKKIKSNMQTKTGKHFKIENFSQNIPDYALYCQIMDGVEDFQTMKGGIYQKITENTEKLKQAKATEDLTIIDDPFCLTESNMEDKKNTNIEIENNPKLDYTKYIKNKLEAYMLSTCFGESIKNAINNANQQYEIAKKQNNLNKTTNSGCCGVPAVDEINSQIPSPFENKTFINALQEYSEKCVKKDINDFAQNMAYYVKLKFMSIMIDFIKKYETNKNKKNSKDNLLEETKKEINNNYQTDKYHFTYWYRPESMRDNGGTRELKEKYKDVTEAIKEQLSSNEKFEYGELEKPVEILQQYMSEYDNSKDASKVLKLLFKDLNKDDFKKFLNNKDLLGNESATIFEQINAKQIDINNLKESIDKALDAQKNNILHSLPKLKIHCHNLSMMNFTLSNEADEKNFDSINNTIDNIMETSYWIFWKENIFSKYQNQALEPLVKAFNFNGTHRKIINNNMLKSYCFQDILGKFDKKKAKDKNTNIKNFVKKELNRYYDFYEDELKYEIEYSDNAKYSSEKPDAQSFLIAGFSPMLKDITGSNKYDELTDIACHYHNRSKLKNAYLSNVVYEFMFKQLMTLCDDRPGQNLRTTITKEELKKITARDKANKKVLEKIEEGIKENNQPENGNKNKNKSKVPQIQSIAEVVKKDEQSNNDKNIHNSSSNNRQNKGLQKPPYNQEQKKANNDTIKQKGIKSIPIC